MALKLQHPDLQHELIPIEDSRCVALDVMTYTVFEVGSVVTTIRLQKLSKDQ